MKNNFPGLCRLHTFLLFSALLLSSLFVHSQDPAAALKEDECQANKKAIAKIEKQLSAINAELSASLTQQEREDKKTQLAQVRRMKNPDSLQWPLFVEIAADNNFKTRNCDESPQATFQCLADLEKKIKSRIDKPVTVSKAELLDKKIEIARQLASYRNNGVDLRCDPPSEDEKIVDIDGAWKNNKDVSYRISQTGTGFTWSVTEFQEKGEGTINDIKVSVRWAGDKGAGSTTGLVILADDTGRATRIEWTNGIIFTRN